MPTLNKIPQKVGPSTRQFGASIPNSDGVRGRTAAQAEQERFPVKRTVYWTFYIFLFSLLFEYPKKTIPMEVPTILGFVFMLAALFLQPRLCFAALPKPLLWFVVFLCAFTLIAISMDSLLSDDPIIRRLTLIALVLNIQIFFLFWIGYNLMRYERIAGTALLVLVIACGILSFMQVNDIETSKAYSYSYGYGKRYLVLGQNPNNTANNLALGLVALIGLVFARNKIRSRYYYLLIPLAPLIGAAIVRAGSRGALLALATGMSVLLLGSTGGKSLWLKIRNALVVAMAIGLLFWAVTQSSFLTSRFEAGTSGRMSGRENIFPAAWQMFLDRPLAGWGPIQNTREMWKRAPVSGREHVASRTIHNMYLGALTSTGLVGSIPLFLCLATCVAAAWKARRGEQGLLPLALVATMLMINMWGDWSLSKLDWLMLSYAVAMATHVAGVRVSNATVPLTTWMRSLPAAAGARRVG